MNIEAPVNRSGRPLYEIDPASGCWNWLGAKNNGYGIRKINGRARYAHIVSFEESSGPVPVGMELDHKCVNRSCVNPEHLEIVTHAVNSQRGVGKLTPDLVRAIRSEYPILTKSELGRKYGVSHSAIWQIITGRTWSNVT